MWYFVVILISLAVGCSSDETFTMVDLWGINNPEVLLNRALEVMQNDSSACESHINFYMDNIMQSEWGMTMFDSSTKIPEGILMLNLIHLGNFDECLSIEGVMGPANDTFDAQHCMVAFSLPWSLFPNLLPNLNMNRRAIARELHLPDDVVQLQEYHPQGRALTPGQMILGLELSYCLPDSCSPEILRYYLNETVSNITQNMMSVQAVACSQGSKGRSLQTEDWIAVTVLIIFGCLCITSTCYDLLKENKKRMEVLTAFSWYSNGKKLLATSDSGSDTLHALHGIRFISICWVVFGHTHMIQVMSPSINQKIMFDFMTDFWRLYVTNATLSVDTFFFLSGLLISYIFLKQMNKSKDSTFNILLYYIHRYIRLTPAYAIMIMIQSTLIRYMGTGPLYDTYIEATIAPCKTHWWTQLLYVNNYVEPNKQCLGQGWYLAVDMQLFILSPIVLIPLWKWSRNLSISFLGILVLCGLATAFSVSQIKELPASLLAGHPDFMRLQYSTTHTRFTPWLIGILFGYLIYETKRRKITIPRVYALLGWLLGCGALLASLLGIYPFHKTNAHPTQLESSFYTTFSRPVWSLGVAWVAFACVSGVGGPVNTFLSWKLFQPLSRLTYCIYLVHMTWLYIKAASVRTAGYLDDIIFIPTFFSDMTISLLLAVILSLCCESPIIILEKHLLGSGGKKSKQTEEVLQGSENVDTSASAQEGLHEDVSTIEVESTNPLEEVHVEYSSANQK